MSTLNVAQKAAEKHVAVKLRYKNEDRLVSPTSVLTVAKTGNVVIVGLEANKGWRRYNMPNIQDIELTNIPHENVDEIDLQSFVGSF